MCEEFMKSDRKHYDDEFHDLHEDARRLLAIFDETHHKCTGTPHLVRVTGCHLITFIVIQEVS